MPGQALIDKLKEKKKNEKEKGILLHFVSEANDSYL